MSEGQECNRILPPDIDTGPQLEVVPDSPERAFFDPNNLPAIDEIDLTPVKDLHKVNFNATGSTALDPKKAVRYLNAAAEGSIDDKTFTPLYERAVGEVLAGTLSPEHLEAIYEAIENQRPRVIELMQRVQAEQILIADEFVTVNKLAIFVSGLRLAQGL